MEILLAEEFWAKEDFIGSLRKKKNLAVIPSMAVCNSATSIYYWYAEFSV
jgi:hypothetical protein